MKKDNKRILSKWSRSDRITLGAMLAPFLIAFLVFMVIPVIASIVLSFFRFDMLGTPEFIGFDNYFRMIMEDKVFGISLANTLYFAVITGPVGFMLSFILAWFINELGPKARSVLSFLFYSPALMGNVYFIWQVMFSGDSYGYVNSLLISLNVISEPIQWFSNPNYSMTLVILIQLWMSMGVSFLANISGLQNVDSTLYEAAAIDGVKNRWQELLYITIPSMGPQLLFAAVMQITASFTAGDIGRSLTAFPSTDYAAWTITHHLDDYGGQRFEVGYSSAIAVVLFAIMIGANGLVKKILSKVGQ